MSYGSWNRMAAYEDVTGTPADFVIGVEESHGVLTTPQIRDKDAGGAAVLMAELALDQKRRGQTVLDYLDGWLGEFGYFRNEGVPIFMRGVEGKRQMTRMLDRLRATPPQEIGGLAVTRFEDLRDEEGRFGPLKGATDAASRNVLVFRCRRTRRGWCLRPSGTEPKAKSLPGSVFAAAACRGRRPRPGGGRVRMWMNGRSAWAEAFECGRRWR